MSYLYIAKQVSFPFDLTLYGLLNTICQKTSAQKFRTLTILQLEVSYAKISKFKHLIQKDNP